MNKRVRPQGDGPLRLAGGRYWTRWAIVPDQMNWRKRPLVRVGPTVPRAEAQGAGRDGDD